MKWQVQETDYDGHSLQLFKDGDEVLSLKFAQNSQSFSLLLLSFCQY